VVVEHGGSGHITSSELEQFGLPGDTRRLLIKTQNGRFWDDPAFHEDFVALDGDAGRWLVDRGVVLVGIDYLSIERFRAPGHRVHIDLLEAGVVIVEGVDLRTVPPASYMMCCAPLKMVGAEGSPARVFLWDEPPD
jgi:arylformamidase